MTAKPLIVTESRFDHVLLAALLISRGVGGFTIVAGRGPDQAVRLAQGKRIERNVPVLVVVDANTTDEAEAHSRSEDLTDFLRLGAGSTPAWVVCAVPAVEAILFRRPDWLRRQLGSIDDRMLRVGKRAPAAVLEEIAGQKWRDALVKRLNEASPDELRTMAADPIVDDIASFVGDPYRFAPKGLAAPRLGFGT